jgi:hypothetical protein
MKIKIRQELQRLAASGKMLQPNKFEHFGQMWNPNLFKFNIAIKRLKINEHFHSS